MSYNHRGVATIKFSELISMTNRQEPHRIVKQRWHKLLLDAEVFGEPHLMRQFIGSLLVLKDYLDDTEQHISWEQMVWMAVDKSSPENWTCV